MKNLTMLLSILLLTTALGTAGCSGQFWGGTAAGVLGTGGGYEYNISQQMKRIEEDYKAGRITKEEYEIRKDQIQRDSLLK